MKLLRELAALIRSMPSFYERRFVAWAHRMALAPHLPQDIGDGSVWCLRERVPWPCDEWVRLTESYQKAEEPRMTVLQGPQSDRPSLPPNCKPGDPVDAKGLRHDWRFVNEDCGTLYRCERCGVEDID